MLYSIGNQFAKDIFPRTAIVVAGFFFFKALCFKKKFFKKLLRPFCPYRQHPSNPFFLARTELYKRTLIKCVPHELSYWHVIVFFTRSVKLQVLCVLCCFGHLYLCDQTLHISTTGNIQARGHAWPAQLHSASSRLRGM